MFLKYKLRKISKEVLYYLNSVFYKKYPIIVYQMGKVGSRSVYRSLLLSNVRPVYHVHRMNYKRIKSIEKKYLENNQMPPDDTLGEILFRNFIQNRTQVKFITLVREPISRNMSAFFQNFSRFTGVEYNNAGFSREELFDIFLKEYSHSVPLNWFDIEMKETLGINVYDYPFPQDKGYLSISVGRFKLLVIKLEIDDATKEKAIADFLGLSNFKLAPDNMAKNKDYADLYRDFTSMIKLPKSYIDKMCESKYTTHFYSESEIQKIRSKW